jgi:hypothetical protein
MYSSYQARASSIVFIRAHDDRTIGGSAIVVDEFLT